MLAPPRLCAIHQPNFFPWLGYFDKIRRADVFVLLDCVDYPRAGSSGMGSIVNRVRISVQGKEHYIGAPLQRAPLGTPISAIQIDDRQPWRDKMIRTLTINYARAANYGCAMELLEPLVRHPVSSLTAFNVHAITTIADHLGLSTEFVLQSMLSPPGAATELLVNLTKASGCIGYLAGGGAGGYQEDHLFAAAGLRLVHQSFKPKPYGPSEKYIGGLSIIDYLMHDGRPLDQTFKSGCLS